MRRKEFYHTKKDACDAAYESISDEKDGFIEPGLCNALNFDFISPDAINDEREGMCHCFWVYNNDGIIVGAFAYNS